MTLAQRFLVVFGVVSLVVLGAYVYVLSALDTMTERGRRERSIAASVEAASRVETESLEVILLLEAFMDAPNPTTLQQFYDGRRLAAAGRQDMRRLSPRPAIGKLIDDYEALLPERIAAADRLIAAVQRQAPAAVVLDLKHARDRLDRRALQYPREIIELEHEALAAVLAETEAYRRTVVWQFTAIASLILLLTVSLSLWTARGLSRRLAPLTAMAGRVATGDFSSRVPVSGGDEIATLTTTLNNMAAQLEELDKVKDEFVALASHQLRTPATAVKGNISMLLDGYVGEVTPRQAEILADANAANERQLAIIDDLLTLASAETGRLTIAPTPTDLAVLLNDVIAEHRFTIAGREQTLDLHVPETLPCVIDPAKMKIVFDNLLSNAVKYTPHGGRIALRASAREGRVVVDVEDTGVGIDPEARGRLFKKFSRIDNPLSVESGGTGLGLYLAQQIVKLHGGAIGVAAATPHGSIFTAAWPRPSR